MSVTTTSFYEVHVVAVLIVLFLALTTLLFILNCLLTICSYNNIKIEWQIDDAQYFENILQLLQRQRDVECGLIKKKIIPIVIKTGPIRSENKDDIQQLLEVTFFLKKKI